MRTDRWTDMRKLMVAFRNYAYAPDNAFLHCGNLMFYAVNGYVNNQKMLSENVLYMALLNSVRGNFDLQ